MQIQNILNRNTDFKEIANYCQCVFVGHELGTNFLDIGEINFHSGIDFEKMELIEELEKIKMEKHQIFLELEEQKKENRILKSELEKSNKKIEQLNQELQKRISQ